MNFALAFAILQSPPIKPFVDQLRSSVSVGNRERVQGCFANQADSSYLFRMANDRGGLRNLKVAVIPAPPGWEGTGKYWAIIHTRQDLEEHHDPVYPVIESGEVWKLGKEIPEDATTGIAIKTAAMQVHILPSTQSVDVHATLDLTITALRRAPLFRLNDIFRVKSAQVSSGAANVIEVENVIPKPQKGDLVHAGSLLIPWEASVSRQCSFDYTGTLNSPHEDKVDDHSCYLTAWWVPSMGRLPFTTMTRVIGPADWVLQSEGPAATPEDKLGRPSMAPNEQVKYFQCDIPISYPKVIGGKYVLAASATVGSRTFRIFHFDPIDKARAEKDLQTIVDSVAWYDEHLGKFPFDEYNCYDADTYYGIESYNYTLLQSKITSWAVSHEAGHTYFGGLVPCAYVHDSWNESMTQYVDSVLHYNDKDQTLENAFRSINLKVPLTEMPVAWEYDSATYMRGAYVLRMLENEIGTGQMYRGMQELIKDRVGKETTWYDLRPYFERSGGKKLDWFWSQWVSSATFPKLEIVDAQGIPTPGGTKVHITVRQSGTPSPFHLRFRVYAKGVTDSVSQIVEMRSPEAAFELNLGQVKAYEAGVDVFGYALAIRVPPVKVKT